MNAPENPRETAGKRQAHAGGDDGGGIRLSSPAPSVPLWHRLLLKVSEISALCGVGQEQVYEWINAGALPTVPHMKQHRVARADLDKFLVSTGLPAIPGDERAA